MLVLNSNSLTWVWKKVCNNAIGKKLENRGKKEKLKIRVVLCSSFFLTVSTSISLKGMNEHILCVKAESWQKAVIPYLHWRNNLGLYYLVCLGWTEVVYVAWNWVLTKSSHSFFKLKGFRLWPGVLGLERSSLLFTCSWVLTKSSPYLNYRDNVGLWPRVLGLD